MTQAYICDAVRTPIGRYAGALSSVRADDLAAIPIKALDGPQCRGELGRNR
jgi:acetyl-CoA acetyltransferase